MKAYFDQNDPTAHCPRFHPWEGANHDPNGRYYDFRAQPDLIPSALEDFAAHRDRAGVNRVFEMIRWLNSNESIFETNDSRLEGPQSNGSPSVCPKGLQLNVGFTVFFREQKRNLSPVSLAAQFTRSRCAPGTDIVAFVERLLQAISQRTEEIPFCCSSVQLMSTFFAQLNVPVQDKLGHILILRTWVWGDTEDELFANLDQTCPPLLESLKECSRMLVS